MKITLSEKGFIVATSETMAESIKLQELFLGKPEKTIRSVGKQWQTSTSNAWSRKHKRTCEVCGKQYKNLRLHFLTAHPVQYKLIYGDTTVSGKTVEQAMLDKPWLYHAKQKTDEQQG